MKNITTPVGQYTAHGCQTYIIAEIGINHNGNVDIAKQLINVAKTSGCNAVKFQKRNPDVCVPDHQKNKRKDTPWGVMSYIEYKRKIELSKKDYDEIDRYCKQIGIEWSASPWDLDSLQFLKQYDIPWIKIPSAMMTNDELIKESLEYCLHNNKKLIVSTGMSTHDELTHCMTISSKIMDEIKLYSDNTNKQTSLIFMHCNSSYPTPIEELNLSCLLYLQNFIYNFSTSDIVKIGYSGHEEDVITTAASIYLGAEYVERHITLDKTMWGSDQKASLEPQELKQLVDYIRILEKAYGKPEIGVTKSEEEVRKKLRGY